MGQTVILLIALLTGLVALVFEGISVGTGNWAEAKYASIKDIDDYLQSNITEEGYNKTVMSNRGFWTFCVFQSAANPSEKPEFVDGCTCVKVCKLVNITFGPDLPESFTETEVAQYGRIFSLERFASYAACLCAALQFCAVLTSFQAAWTMVPVLFTDCGVMFLFGAFFQLMTLILYMCALTYENMEVADTRDPSPLNMKPNGYYVTYAYSFYLGLVSFLMGFVTGVLYLLLARAHEKEEVWLKPMGTEKKGGKL